MLLVGRYQANPIQSQHGSERAGYRCGPFRGILGTGSRGGRADLWLKMAPGTGRCAPEILGRGAARVSSLPQMPSHGMHALFQCQTESLYVLRSRPESRWHYVPARNEYRGAAQTNRAELSCPAVQY